MNTTVAMKEDALIPQQKLAAIVVQSDEQFDEYLDQLFSELEQEGVCIAGLRQRLIPGSVAGCNVRLQDIQTGQLHRITQDLGTGSTSCNIDTAAVEQLALSQSNELDESVDLMFVNRFGKREWQGAGFCCAIERAIELDIPVLTVVRSTSLQAWLDYGGEWVTTLPAKKHAIRQWCEQVLTVSA